MTIHKALDKRIETLTAGESVMNDPHAAPENMKREVSYASNRHDLRLLKLYEKYLSMEFTPHTIKKVLAALTGNEDYSPENTLDEAYEKVTSIHLDAYRRVLHSLGDGHPAWSTMAQAAAIHPESVDQIVEYAVQGKVEPSEVMELVRANEAPASTSIVNIMDTHRATVYQPRPVAL